MNEQKMFVSLNLYTRPILKINTHNLILRVLILSILSRDLISRLIGKRQGLVSRLFWKTKHS